MIRALERPLKDRVALLEAKNQDFYTVLVASTKREEERNRAEAQQRKDDLVVKTRIVGRLEAFLLYSNSFMVQLFGLAVWTLTTAI